jgi:hypothetical protein
MENRAQVESARLRQAIIWRQVTRDILRLLYWGVALGLLLGLCWALSLV